MLKGIPSILSPELLKILMEMGHGDEIVIADGNFPSSAMLSALCGWTATASPRSLTL